MRGRKFGVTMIHPLQFLRAALTARFDFRGEHPLGVLLWDALLVTLGGVGYEPSQRLRERVKG